MRKASKNVLGVDLSLQVVLVGFMLVFYVLGLASRSFLVLALLAQLGVGVVQVLSGLLHSISYQDKTRQKYTVFALFYVVGLILGGSLILDWVILGFFVIFVALIPVGIAIWYCNLTYQDWKSTVAISKGMKHQNLGQEDILDDVEWQ